MRQTRKRIHGTVLARVTGFLSSDPAGTGDTEYAAPTAHILLKYGPDLTSADVAHEWTIASVGQKTPFEGGGFSEMDAIHYLTKGLTVMVHRRGQAPSIPRVAVRAETS